MNKALLTLAAIGSVIAMSAPAHASGSHIVATGVNTGSAGFTMAVYATGPVTDPNHHQITHYCNFLVTGVGNDIVITIAANATSGAHLIGVSTGIYCDVRDSHGNIVHSAAVALPGVAAAVVSPSPLLWNDGPYTVCSRGTGQWIDTHLHATPLHCQAPNLPVRPPSSSVLDGILGT